MDLTSGRFVTFDRSELALSANCELDLKPTDRKEDACVSQIDC